LRQATRDLPAAGVPAAADALTGADYLTDLIGNLEPDAVERLARYVQYLDWGGRPKRFRPPRPSNSPPRCRANSGWAHSARHELGLLHQALRFLRLAAPRMTRSTPRAFLTRPAAICPGAVARRG
jgi:hypothetical protein